MQNGENGTERDQQPNHSAGMVSHEIQQRVCGHRDGDRQIAILINGRDKQKRTDQRGDQKAEKQFLFQA